MNCIEPRQIALGNHPTRVTMKTLPPPRPSQKPSSALPWTPPSAITTRRGGKKRKMGDNHHHLPTSYPEHGRSGNHPAEMKGFGRDFPAVRRTFAPSLNASFFTEGVRSRAAQGFAVSGAVRHFLSPSAGRLRQFCIFFVPVSLQTCPELACFHSCEPNARGTTVAWEYGGRRGTVPAPSP